MKVFKSRVKVLDAFKCGIFLLSPTKGKGQFSNLARVACIAEISKHKCLRLLTFKQMLERLPIVHAQVKASNASEKLLNETCQITYSLQLTKEIKKVYNNEFNKVIK